MLDINTLRGEPIKIGDEKTRHYKISFEEVHWLEEAGDCINYGDGAQYMSYADCVAQEHAEIFEPILGCRPPWLSAPGHPENCQGKILWANVQSKEWRRSIKEFELNYLISGKAHTENCLKPCKGLLAYSKLIRSEDYRRDFAKTFLNFPKEVKVTKYVRTYGLFELVVDVGSSLGLWIGLSIVGVFDIVLNTGIFIKKSSCERKKDTKQERLRPYTRARGGRSDTRRRFARRQGMQGWNARASRSPTAVSAARAAADAIKVIDKRILISQNQTHSIFREKEAR